MKRLNSEDHNSPEEYKKIGFTPFDWFEAKRWKELLKYWKGGKMIDIGSFDSMVPILAKAKYPDSEILAMDYMYEGVHKFSGIVYEEGDAYKTERVSQAFDYVVMGQLLEHLEDPVAVVKEGMRLLKSGGILALSVPLDETKLGEVDKDHHLWSFSRKDIEELLKPYGLYEINILRSQYLPEYKYHFPNVVAFCQKF